MLTVLGFSLLLGGAAAPDAPPAVPYEIGEHYREYNFVNAFSTSSERRVMAQSRRVPEDRRLARVARALARLASRTDEVDPGILYGTRRRDASEFRSGLVRIASCRVDEKKGEAWVHLEVLTLDRGTQGTLVASYDRLTRGGESMPAIDELMAVIVGPPARTAEIHRWVRVAGEWRRDAAVLHFVSF